MGRLADPVGAVAAELHAVIGEVVQGFLRALDGEQGVVVSSAPSLLSVHPPIEALRMWLDRLARDIRIKHGFGEVLNPAAHDSVARETYAPVVGAIDLMLEAGKRAGTVRKDLDADELLLMMSFASRAEPGGKGDAKVRRMLDVLTDGLRTSR